MKTRNHRLKGGKIFTEEGKGKIKMIVKRKEGRKE